VRGRRAPLIAGAAVGLVALLFIFFLVLPKMHAVTKTESQLEKAKNEQTALQSQLAALQQAQKDAPETQEELAAVAEQVPATAQLPELILQMQAAADRAAVDFFSFSPGVPVASAAGTYSTLASQITVNGTYFAVDEFLFLLETLPRAAKVTSITVAPGGGGETTAPTTTPTTPTAAPTASTLTLQVSVEFYTTDTSAGPGSTPGPSNATGATGATGVATGPSGGTGTRTTGTTAVPSIPAPTGGNP
jgi:Tfp pilus assembly protein PilO